MEVSVRIEIQKDSSIKYFEESHLLRISIGIDNVFKKNPNCSNNRVLFIDKESFFCIENDREAELEERLEISSSCIIESLEVFSKTSIRIQVSKIERKVQILFSPKELSLILLS